MKLNGNDLFKIKAILLTRKTYLLTKKSNLKLKNGLYLACELEIEEIKTLLKKIELISAK